jgi:signal transduction histidine kinase/ligand-binding sensor domain-containing protein
VLAIAAAWFVLAAHAHGAAGEAAPFFFQTWQTDDGLPQKHITAIVQTRDGYLWLGTYNGLARFDGRRFVVFNAANTPGLASSRITSLCEDANGVLWLGHDAGELTRLRDGHFEPVPLATQWPGGAIAAIAEDGRNDVWLLHQSGLMIRVRDGDTAPPEAGLTAATVLSLVRDSEGTLWRAHGGRMRVVGTPSPAHTVQPPPNNDFIVRACASRAGAFWIAGGERVRHWDGKGRERNWGPVPWGNNFVTAMRESRDGQLWVGTLGKGVFVLSPNGRFSQFTRTNGLAHDWVRCLGADQEGTIWVGTGGGGLSAARERRVTMVESPDGWQGRGVLSLCAATNGAVWIGTEGGGVYRLHNGGWKRFGEREGLTNLFVWSMFEDAQGRLLAGTWGGGLFQWVDGRFVHPSAVAGETVPITSMISSRDGALWTGTQRGLVRLAGGKVERFARDLPRPDVRTLAEAKDGAIWFGMSGGGLGRLRDGSVTQFHRKDGLPSDHVWSLLTEKDGTLWIGTFGGGLCRWRNGKFASIGPREGLPNNVISHLMDDGLGRLWMGSYGGILRASKEELNRCADGRAKSATFFVYGKADGLESLETAEGLKPGSCRTSDGRLWFPTSKGPAVVDPANVRTNPLAPPVVIEELLVDGVSSFGFRVSGSVPGHQLDPLETRNPKPETLQIPPGRQRFEFRFTALSFVAPERVRFKYRLEGLENDWVETAERTVNYNFLPPRDYAFRVIACNNDGVWNETGATLALTVLPHFWQAWWFRIVAALAAAAAGGGAVRGFTRRRYRRKLERLERQRAIEKERSRIARDIHDDLGASLTRITLLSQTARGDLDQPELAAADLDRIYDTARELTQAMDEIVWAVNPQHDTLDSLVSYLGGFAQDFLSTAGVRCRLAVPMHPPALPVTAEVRHNLFLAFKEAMHNVVRHATATEARIVFNLEPEGFTLAVQDNGKGFDPSINAQHSTLNIERSKAEASSTSHLASGNGLSNMRKRLDEIGGQCTIGSTLGQGTVVTFKLPQKPRRE